MNRISRVITILVLAVTSGAAASQASALACKLTSSKLKLQLTRGGAYVGPVSGELNGTLAITPIDDSKPLPALVPTPTPRALYEVLFVANDLTTDSGKNNSFRAIVDASDVPRDKQRVDRFSTGQIMTGSGSYEGASGAVVMQTMINATRGVQKGSADIEICLGK